MSRWAARSRQSPTDEMTRPRRASIADPSVPEPI
jgi:hypothetical protein